MCPIFQISNVTGENMDLLKMFLNLLSPRTSFNNEEPAEFQIDDTYSVPVRTQTPRLASPLLPKPDVTQGLCSPPVRAWARWCPGPRYRA